MIFLDTNVISETLSKAPDEAVMAWLVRYDAELALSTIAVAEIAFGIQKIRPDQRADRHPTRSAFDKKGLKRFALSQTRQHNPAEGSLVHVPPRGIYALPFAGAVLPAIVTTADRCIQ